MLLTSCHRRRYAHNGFGKFRLTICLCCCLTYSQQCTAGSSVCRLSVTSSLRLCFALPLLSAGVVVAAFVSCKLLTSGCKQRSTQQVVATAAACPTLRSTRVVVLKLLLSVQLSSAQFLACCDSQGKLYEMYVNLGSAASTSLIHTRSSSTGSRAAATEGVAPAKARRR